MSVVVNIPIKSISIDRWKKHGCPHCHGKHPLRLSRSVLLAVIKCPKCNIDLAVEPGDKPYFCHNIVEIKPAPLLPIPRPRLQRKKSYCVANVSDVRDAQKGEHLCFACHASLTTKSFSMTMRSKKGIQWIRSTLTHEGVDGYEIKNKVVALFTCEEHERCLNILQWFCKSDGEISPNKLRVALE